MRLLPARRSLLLGTALIALAHTQGGCEDAQPTDPSSQLWLHQLGTTQDDALQAVAGAGSAVYAVGTTSGTLPGYTGTSQPPDALVVKLDPSGKLAWQNQYGTAGDDAWRGVAVDASGGAYVAGYTSSAYPGQTRVGGSTDAVLAHLKPDGTLDWVRQFGTVGDDYLLGVTVDGSGNAYAAGWTSGTFTGQFLSGTSDGFVVKFRPDGTQDWLAQFGSPKEDSLSSIALDGSGALFVAGWATDAAAAGQQPFGGRDGVLYKVQPGSGVVWARQFGTSADDEAAAVGVSGSNVYAVGRTLGTLPGQAANGRLDGMAASYDTSGGQRWLRQIGTAGDDELLTLSVATDGSGIYVGGYVSRALPPGMWQGQQDAVYFKMSSDGGQTWVSQFGTAFNDQVRGLWASGPGSLYVVGTVGDALTGQTRVGGIDAFVARYSVP